MPMRWKVSAAIASKDAAGGSVPVNPLIRVGAPPLLTRTSMPAAMSLVVGRKCGAACCRFRFDLPKMWSLLHNATQENLPCSHPVLFHLGASADNSGMI